jgi:hypothetical protein
MVHRVPPYEETGNRRLIAEISNEIATIRHHG